MQSPALTLRIVNIQALTPTIGAEIFNLDLSQDLDNAVCTQIKQAFLEHQVLFIRNQALLPEHIVTFARQFGSVGAYPFAEPLPDHPEVIAIIKEPHQKTVFGGIWHTDSAYLETPSMASVLYAVEVPPLGGDTLFSNQQAAFAALDNATRTKLRTFHAVHSSAKNQHKLRNDHLTTGAMKQQQKPILEATHPVVRTHPVTGTESLYLSPAHTTRIVELSEDDSDSLLAELFSHALSDDFKCRVRWQQGTLAIWDNRCTLHYPINDYGGHRREMYRVTIDGDRPR